MAMKRMCKSYNEATARINSLPYVRWSPCDHTRFSRDSLPLSYLQAMDDLCCVPFSDAPITKSSKPANVVSLKRKNNGSNEVFKVQSLQLYLS